MKKIFLKRPRTFVLAGLAIIIFGLVYGVLFAGIPYQDPTPAQQASWLFHNDVSMKIMLVGLVVLIIGAVWKIAVWIGAPIK